MPTPISLRFSRRHQLIAFSLAFVAGFLMLIGGTYLFPLMMDFTLIGVTLSFLVVGIPVALVTAFLPIFLLKRLASLSRRVEGDDSEMDFTHFADDQPELHYDTPRHGEQPVFGKRPSRRRYAIETGRYA